LICPYDPHQNLQLNQSNELITESTDEEDDDSQDSQKLSEKSKQEIITAPNPNQPNQEDHSESQKSIPTSSDEELVKKKSRYISYENPALPMGWVQGNTSFYRELLMICVGIQLIFIDIVLDPEEPDVLKVGDRVLCLSGEFAGGSSRYGNVVGTQTVMP
jgi:hypothetical protein